VGCILVVENFIKHTVVIRVGDGDKVTVLVAPYDRVYSAKDLDVSIGLNQCADVCGISKLRKHNVYCCLNNGQR